MATPSARRISTPDSGTLLLEYENLADAYLRSLTAIPMQNDLFSTVNRIKTLKVKGRSTQLQGIFVNGRLALVHAPEGLNNAANAKCCCCGEAEISEARQVNVNAVACALLH